MFDYLNKKIRNSIIISIVSVLFVECFSIFAVYSFLNLNDYSKKVQHVCNQLTAYVDLRLKSYEKSTEYFINNNNLSYLVVNRSPKLMELFSEFMTSNIGIENVLLYNDDILFPYESNMISQIEPYIVNARNNHNLHNIPHWDIFNGRLIYSYPILNDGDELVGVFLLSVSTNMLSDNSIDNYPTSMLNNTITYISFNQDSYAVLKPAHGYSKKAKLEFIFSNQEKEYRKNSIYVYNKRLFHKDMFIQVHTPLNSVYKNIAIIGIGVLLIFLSFSIIAFIAITKYSNVLVLKLSELSTKIKNFAKSRV